MTSPIRILDTGLKPARWNVAMTAALCRRHADGAAPETIRFHRYPACVLLGRSQDPADAVDLDYCEKGGIEIVHRVTGGGAVYMSPRMLAWDVVLDRGSLASDLHTATRRICEGVAAGLSLLGCAARFRPANDIEVGGLKVSGSSGYAEGRSLALQGTILIEDEVPDMASALGIPEAVLRSEVTCVAAALGAPPPQMHLQLLVVHGLMEALDRTPHYQAVDEGDLASLDAFLRDRAGSGADAAATEKVRVTGSSA